MNLFTAFICYVLATVICIGMPILIAVLSTRKGLRIKGWHLIFGVAFFSIFFIAYYLVLKFHLTTAQGITEYYNTTTYRVMIISFLTIILSVLLWLFGMIVYMRRQFYDECLSFFAGFGCGGCVLVGGYALLMSLTLAIQCVSSSLLYFDTTVQAFYFNDETYFSVFLPMSGHISFAIAAFCFLIIMLTFALLLNRITSNLVPIWKSMLSFIGLILSLTALLAVFCFMTMLDCPHYVMAMISSICAGICLGLTYLTYRCSRHSDGAYKKQFE